MRQEVGVNVLAPAGIVELSRCAIVMVEGLRRPSAGLAEKSSPQLVIQGYGWRVGSVNRNLSWWDSGCRIVGSVL